MAPPRPGDHTSVAVANKAKPRSPGAGSLTWDAAVGADLGAPQAFRHPLTREENAFHDEPSVSPLELTIDLPVADAFRVSYTRVS